MDGSRKAKSPSSMHIKMAANGGAIVRHEFDNYDSGPSYTPSQEHAFTDRASALKHIAKHFGKGHGGQKTAPTAALGARASKTRGRGVD